MQIFRRILAPTPPFFKKLRNAGLACTAFSLTLLAAPVPLPGNVQQAISYLWVAGAVAGVVSQSATFTEPLNRNSHGRGGTQ